jgi:hypothetical protein
MNLDDLMGATTMCELLERNPKGGMGTPSPSLGLTKPTKVIVTVDHTVGRGMRPQRRRSARHPAPDLFGTSLRPLQPAPFAVKYHYHCESAGCGAGHHPEDARLGGRPGR